jgi:hypothetical protein
LFNHVSRWLEEMRAFGELFGETRQAAEQGR